MMCCTLVKGFCVFSAAVVILIGAFYQTVHVDRDCDTAKIPHSTQRWRPSSLVATRERINLVIP